MSGAIRGLGLFGGWDYSGGRDYSGGWDYSAGRAGYPVVNLHVLHDERRLRHRSRTGMHRRPRDTFLYLLSCILIIGGAFMASAGARSSGWADPVLTAVGGSFLVAGLGLVVLILAAQGPGGRRDA